jgi:hypothetical protein
VARRSGTSEEAEHHVVGLKMRVTGSGNLDMSLSDLDDVQTQTLVPFAMSTTTRFEPVRLANFQSQRVRLTIRTDTINEVFLIKRILIYAKPVAIEYPA